jgi:MFS family permease
MPRVLSKSEHGRFAERPYIPIYAASLLLIFHTYVVAFINSSYLEQFLTTKTIGTIYSISAIGTIILFFIIPTVLRKIGNTKVILSLLILNGLAVLGTIATTTLWVAVPLLILHLMLVPLMIFSLDVFMEERIGKEEMVTGSRRGLLLALMSVVSACSPLVSSLLIEKGGGSFHWVYIVSALSLLPIIYIVLKYFRTFIDPPYETIRPFSAIKNAWNTLDTRAVFFVHFILQIFFVSMVVFTPIYLIEHIGLSWKEFGIIMLIGQSAYILFEYPIGIIADRYIGEKEMMALGLCILTVSTAALSFVQSTEIITWAVLMFVTRVGASFVEVTTEVHFFKRAQGSDTQIISLFRMLRPLSYVIGATIASISLVLLPFHFLYIVIAILCIPALFTTLYIVDSK